MSMASYQFNTALQMMAAHPSPATTLGWVDSLLQRWINMATRHAELSYGADLRTLPHF